MGRAFIGGGTDERLELGVAMIPVNGGAR